MVGCAHVQFETDAGLGIGVIVEQESRCIHYEHIVVYNMYMHNL